LRNRNRSRLNLKHGIGRPLTNSCGNQKRVVVTGINNSRESNCVGSRFPDPRRQPHPDDWLKRPQDEINSAWRDHSFGINEWYVGDAE
jgi:hypothetical protein